MSRNKYYVLKLHKFKFSGENRQSNEGKNRVIKVEVCTMRRKKRGIKKIIIIKQKEKRL